MISNFLFQDYTTFQLLGCVDSLSKEQNGLQSLQGAFLCHHPCWDGCFSAVTADKSAILL